MKFLISFLAFLIAVSAGNLGAPTSKGLESKMLGPELEPNGSESKARGSEAKTRDLKGMQARELSGRHAGYDMGIFDECSYVKHSIDGGRLLYTTHYCDLPVKY